MGSNVLPFFVFRIPPEVQLQGAAHSSSKGARDALQGAQLRNAEVLVDDVFGVIC